MDATLVTLEYHGYIATLFVCLAIILYQALLGWRRVGTDDKDRTYCQLFKMILWNFVRYDSWKGFI